ncbi:putative HSP60 fold T-complex protein 1 theta subunit [Babesia bovis T2Bo]|uniref:CCT-theta n=1 Tax=Babesia bovis TaxID=5865 RepID=A7ASM9_BABBO|nr:putative HSP60 fold T-complex protein 1 theta subunit [Babesia bovis T2Bo]EDO07548.1 putative HSP60 fold T-complex protein 1 theta subunit [Babesia bovis T2Bo]|eukprot:XP_001611116.1 HSP60 fold T-complex protein 1 [Babesia bovis T2Bo]
MFAQRFGPQALMRSGGRMLGPSDNAIVRNIEACAAIADMLKTSLGPNGMKKLIVNHIEKRFVTSDCETILSGVDVQHPAAKVLAMAVQTMQNEFGDGTNTLIALAGEMLSNAALLIEEGLHISDIRLGYELGYKRLLELFDNEVVWEVSNIRDESQLKDVVGTCIAGKHISRPEFITSLVAKACASIIPPDAKQFDVDNVRVLKITGGSLDQSSVMNGMAIVREVSGMVKKVGRTKVLVIAGGLEFAGTEAKSTVMLHSAEELLNFTKGEEAEMERVIRSIKDRGVGCVIANGAVSDLALHYCNAMGIMVVKITSKFELRRLCRSLGATAVVKFESPSEDDLGIVESVEMVDISSHKTLIFQAVDHRLSTIILKGATQGMLDEIERAIDDALCSISAAIRDPRYLPGGGAFEIEMARQLAKFSQTLSGLEQHAARKFAESFEVIPKVLASNAGHDATVVITELYAAHDSGDRFACVSSDLESRLSDAKLERVYDHYIVKMFSIKLAYEAVSTILSVDQLIMAKPAGGPKPREPGPPDL